MNCLKCGKPMVMNGYILHSTPYLCKCEDWYCEACDLYRVGNCEENFDDYDDCYDEDDKE